MANTYKNIVITPNIGSNTADPRIQFSGGNTTVNTDINMFVYPAANGTLSFEGSAGQLFSITNDLANLLFSVADVSGIPSLEIYANGLVSIAQFSGNVGIGNTSPNAKLAVTGAANVSGNVTIGGITTFNGNVVLGSVSLSANGSLGTAGHVLHSNGTATYWAADDNSGGTVTSVATGNGLTGGPITSTGTVSILANNGITSNSTGLFVTQGTGTVVNATGVHVNDSYIATLTANNTSFVGSVSAANVVSNAQLSANLANYAALSGATFTGAVVISNNLSVTGNLTLSGNTLIVGANNLVVSDAIISLHTPANLSQLTSNDGRNIGLAFHYYDTEDRHALLYRDNSTGRLQFHTDGGDPQTNSNPTGNSLGTIQAGSFWAGNDSVYATINSTSYTGAANSSLYANASISNTFTVGSAAYFVANGNIGIGNTAPASKLVIQDTLTANAAATFEINPTWNATANTFTALRINATDTASNASSLLMDLQTGGATRFRVFKNGYIYTPSAATGGMISGDSQSTGAAIGYWNGSGGVHLGNLANIFWGTGGPNSQALDLVIGRDAADILAQKRGVNAQTSRIYGTFTDASNYERLSLSSNSSATYIMSERAGTGAYKDLFISGGGDAKAVILYSGSNGKVRLETGGNQHIELLPDVGSVVITRKAAATSSFANFLTLASNGAGSFTFSTKADSSTNYTNRILSGGSYTKQFEIGASGQAGGQVGTDVYMFSGVPGTNTLRAGNFYIYGAESGGSGAPGNIVLQGNGTVVYAGNVGIGNNAPDAKLAVTGTANVSGNVVIGGSLTSANLTIGSSTVNSTVIAVGANVYANTTALDVGNTIITSTNLTLGGGITANGDLGSAGQVLTSNGSSAYWSTVSGVNTDAQYTWANVQTFNANVVISNTAELVFASNAGIVANGGLGSAGQVLTSNGSSVYWSTVTGGGGAPTANVITNTAFTAVKDNRYFLTNASSTTMTLPATPSVGDTVYVVVTNNLANNVVARNGSNIMSLAENLILDVNYTSIGLTYVTANLGWVII